MQLTAKQVHAAFRGADSILNGKRDITTLAKFRIARIHEALEKDYNRLEDTRKTLVQTHGEETFADEEKKLSTGWRVVPDTAGFAAYVKEWESLLDAVLDVHVTPVPLAAFGDSNHGVEAMEFRLLGPLVSESRE